MLDLLAVGVVESAFMLGGPMMDLGRGAIAGAMIVGTAFLAGYAAIKRSGLAFCGFLMVAMASLLEFSWLGLLPSLPPEGSVLLLGLFAASSVVFLSATINAAKQNPLLGGFMFTAALVLGGLGFINFVDRIDAAPVMAWAAIAVGAFALFLATTQAVRGEAGARLILPGIVLALAAPLLGPLGAFEGGAAAMAAHGLFALGVLAASMVSLTEGVPAQALRSVAPAAVATSSFAQANASFEPSNAGSTSTAARERAEVVIDSQLGRVLDYAGIAIWDWSEDIIDQTESLPSLLGADSDAPFTPDAMRQFVHKDDLKLLETGVLKAEDGPFDVVLTLFDGRRIRMRGARAAANEAALERVVAFVEPATNEPGAVGDDDSRRVQDATKAAVVPATSGTESKTKTFNVEDVVAAFQPIVCLKDMKIAGYEALARLHGKEGDTASLIRAASHAGKSDAFALSMLRQAAEHLAEQRKTLGADASPFVAMNVSWSQMQQPKFASAVEEVFKKYELPKGALVLELTEGEAVGNETAAEPVFRKLKELGAALAFDDFGAGFSCLSNVRKYDFDYIKIDKSFADDLDANGDGAKIVAALADMGAKLGLNVIVEGVETNSAAKTALSLGCTHAQGYALGRPDIASARDKSDEKTQQASKASSNKAKASTNPADAEDLAVDLKAEETAPANDVKTESQWLWRRSRAR